MVYGLLVSVWDRNSERRLADTTFVGFSNYLMALRASAFWQTFANSLLFCLIYTVVIMAGGLFSAIVLNARFRGRTVVRAAFYMPYVTNMIAVGVVFKYLLHPSKGPVNAVFRLFGKTGPLWLNSVRLALPTVAVIAAWAAMALHIITCLAALQDIPQDLYEVAQIEGAGFFQRLFAIVIPHLAPTLFMLLTITLINSFKNYTIIIGLTGGGPGTATRVLSLQIYQDAFRYMKFSVAAAEGVLFTLFIIALNAVVGKARSRWDTP